jgi:hypothetical protein
MTYIKNLKTMMLFLILILVLWGIVIGIIGGTIFVLSYPEYWYALIWIPILSFFLVPFIPILADYLFDWIDM